MDTQGNAVEAEDFQPDYYCKHGTFIGNPYGADYMCGWCESGVSDADYDAHTARQQRNARWRRMMDAIVTNMSRAFDAQPLIGHDPAVISHVVGICRLLDRPLWLDHFITIDSEEEK